MAQAPDPNGSDGLGGYLDNLAGKTTSTTNAAPLPSPNGGGRPASDHALASGATPAAGTGLVRSVLDLGMTFLGTPYKWGGSTPQTGFDCSGLLQYIYAQNGVKIPRVSAEQARAGVAVTPKNAQPGDLIAFDNDPSRPGVDHIGIYLGGGKMLQSPHTGASVQVVSVNLGSAAAIRRVATSPSAFTGLGGDGKHYVYQAAVTPGATAPRTITPGKGGGDPANAPAGAVPAPAQAAAPTPAAGGGPLPANATPQQIHDEVARSYGYLAAFLNDKEIGPILTRAAMEDWDEAKLTGALTATKWWKTTSDTARQWDALNKLDPAKAKSQLDQQMAQMRDVAEQQGVVLTGLQLHDISVNSLRFGWNAAQTKDALLQQGKHDPRADTARKYDQLLTEDPASAQKMLDDSVRDVQSRATQLGVVVSADQAKNLGQQALRGAWDASRTVDELLRVGTRSTDPKAAGAVQTDASSLREMASSYLVPLSDQTLNAWSERIARGQGTANDFQTYLKEQAKILRPWMSKQIDDGLTVAQYADPFRQIAARELEINPDDVDLSSARYSRFIDGTVDKDGNRKPMSLADVQDYVRTLPEWSYTKAAHAQAADLTQSILGTLGKIA